MGHVPETNGVPLYNKEATVKPLKMDNRPVRTPILRRLTRLMERDDLTAVVADTYDFEDAAQAHRDILAGGSVGKLGAESRARFRSTPLRSGDRR